MRTTSWCSSRRVGAVRAAGGSRPRRRCFRYARRGVERRDLAAASSGACHGRIGAAVDAGVARASSSPTPRAASAPGARACGELADARSRGSASHGSSSAPAGCSPGPGQVEERRQQRAVFDRAGATTCGTGERRAPSALAAAGVARRRGRELVVPRSMPTDRARPLTAPPPPARRWRVDAGRGRGQGHALGSPAVVAQLPLKGGCPTTLPLRRTAAAIEAGRHLDGRALRCRSTARAGTAPGWRACTRRERSGQRRRRRRRESRSGPPREVHQPALPLQDAQELQRGPAQTASGDGPAGCGAGAARCDSPATGSAKTAGRPTGVGAGRVAAEARPPAAAPRAWTASATCVRKAQRRARRKQGRVAGAGQCRAVHRWLPGEWPRRTPADTLASPWRKIRRLAHAGRPPDSGCDPLAGTAPRNPDPDREQASTAVTCPGRDARIGS